MRGRRIFLKERAESSSADKVLRASRSWDMVVIFEKSFVAIEDVDEEFHKNIREEFLPDEEDHQEGN